MCVLLKLLADRAERNMVERDENLMTYCGAIF